MRALLLLPLLVGCLEVPSGQGQECKVDSDCNTATGEACYQGLCYGDPPLGTYAATLSAPAAREDLIATEIPLLALPQNGDLGALQLEAPVTFSGRVEVACTMSQTTCSTLSIGAQIRITRPSRFPGGPALRLVAISKADIPRGTDSFSIHLPRMHPGDPPYTVTIDPEGGGDLPPTHGGKDPAQVVPPKRIELAADSLLEHQTYTLGVNAVQITGVIKDGLGSYLTQYRVAALGRWDMTSALSEVSSVHYSTDGTYSIEISEGVVGSVEIVARPYDPQVVATELHATGVGPYSQVKNLYQPTGIGQRVDVSIPIEALSGDGSVKPVSGAHVIVTGATESPFATSVRAVLVAEATTADDGIAKLSLLDGSALASSYRIRVVPPGGSTAGVVFDDPVTLPTPMRVRLPQRVALRGSLVDTSGKPLADVSVTARRSLRFLWSLPGAQQSFLDEIPAATAITPDTGDFVLWLDPTVASTWGHYDLFFETPDNSASPNWLVPDFEIPRILGQTAISLDAVTIPDAARIHGTVVDGAGVPVEGSALRIFRLSSNDTLCSEVTNAPAECSDDAKVMGHGETDDAGFVRLNLPRP
ncbi:MAG TPA: hypothetical protein VIV40_42215 [Kofleriaceae bacterium]